MMDETTRLTRVAKALLSHHAAFGTDTTWQNTLSFNSKAGSTEIVPPRVVEAAKERLRDDALFRARVLQELWTQDIRSMKSRWDRTTPMSAEQRMRRTQIMKDRMNARLHKIDMLPTSSTQSAPVKPLKTGQPPNALMDAVAAHLQSAEASSSPQLKIHVNEGTSFDNAPDSTSKLHTVDWDKVKHETGERVRDSKSFFALATNDALVHVVKGVLRQNYKEMYGVVATTFIPAGTMILSWPGVDVDEATFLESKPLICNKEHVLEYAMTYQTEDGTTRVVCPRLTAQGKPSTTATGEYDACWACFINEPMLHHRMRYVNETIQFKYTKKRVKANSRYTIRGNRPVVVTCQDIKEGDEITMRYGDDRSYSKGIYSVGDHASVGGCPNYPSEPAHWSERPGVPSDSVFVRYLLPEYHSMAEQVYNELVELEQAKADANHAQQRANQTYSVRREHVATYKWQQVDDACVETVQRLLSYEDRPKIRRIRIRLFFLFFAPLDMMPSSENPDWHIELRRNIREYMRHSTSELMHEAVFDIWRSICTIADDGRARVVECPLTDDTANLLHDFPDETQEAQRVHDALVSICKELTMFCKTTEKTHSIMLQYYESWQIKRDKLQILHN